MYALDPDLAALFSRWPPRVLISTVPCPACGRRAVVDGVRKEIACYHHREGIRTFPLAARLADADRPRLPDDLRAYYPQGVTCPADGVRLRLRLTDAEGTCPACGGVFTFDHLRDAAAQRLMEEAPLGATIYHRPRH